MKDYSASLFIAKVLKRVPGMSGFSRSFNLWRHRRIARELDDLFREALCSMRQTGEVCKSDNFGPIWVFWAQGIEGAPISVRACIASMERFSADRPVCVLTLDNVRQYTTLSENVFELCDKGIISLTHLSDLIRCNLLKNYGGMWMDASFLAVDDLLFPKDSRIYTCAGQADPTNFNVANGRWLGGFIGGPAGHPHFQYMDKVFELYWGRYDSLIDYFLIDYAVEFSWKNNIGGFREDCDRAVGRNPMIFELRRLLDKPFDERLWNELCSQTRVFCINYKWVPAIKSGSFAEFLTGDYVSNLSVPAQQ